MDDNDLRFYQDGALSHTAHQTIDLLRTKFDYRGACKQPP